MKTIHRASEQTLTLSVDNSRLRIRRRKKKEKKKIVKWKMSDNNEIGN